MSRRRRPRRAGGWHDHRRPHGAGACLPGSSSADYIDALDKLVLDIALARRHGSDRAHLAPAVSSCAFALAALAAGVANLLTRSNAAGGSPSLAGARRVTTGPRYHDVVLEVIGAGICGTDGVSREG